LRDNPRDAYDRPLYAMAGRTMLFTDQHVKRLLESLPCPSRSSRPATPGRRTSTSAALTSASEWTRKTTTDRPRLHANLDRGDWMPLGPIAGDRLHPDLSRKAFRT
jgi:hypothetical protein